MWLESRFLIRIKSKYMLLVYANMRFKSLIALVMGFLIGFLSYALQGRIGEKVSYDCELNSDHILLEKGIIRNRTYRIPYSNVESISFETGILDTILDRERIVIYTTSTDRRDLSVSVDYDVGEEIRLRMEEEWEE